MTSNCSRTRAVSVVGSLLLSALVAHSQSMPAAPANPKTRQDCEDYRNEFQSYLRDGHKRVQECLSSSRSDPITQWVQSSGCSGISMQVPPECKADREQIECASDSFLPSYRECLGKVASNANGVDSIQRKLMLDTAAGVPKSATSQGLKMAGLLAGQGNLSTSKELIATIAKGSLWMREKNGNLKQLKSSTPMIERLSWVIGKAPSNKGLSKELLSVSIKGLNTVSKDALDELASQIDQFSKSIEQDHQDAIEQMHQQRLDNMTPPPPPPPPPPVQAYRPPPRQYSPPVQSAPSWQDQFCSAGIAVVQSCVFNQNGCSLGSINGCWGVCGLGDYVNGGPGCQ